MDPENGNPTTDPAAVPATEPTQVTPTTEQVTTPPDPNQTVGAALDAFNKELGRPPTVPPDSGSKIAGAADEGEPGSQGGDQVAPSRIFEGLEPEEIEYFKRMSNKAYDHLYPAYKEYKTLKTDYAKAQEDLKKLQGSSYFDHEEAYRLAPEYNQMTNAITRFQGELQFWQDQLTAVEAGEKFQDLRYDPQSGKYELSAEMEPSPQAKSYLINQISKCHQLVSNTQSKLEEFQGTFKNNHQTYLKGLSEAEAKVFEGLDAKNRAAVAKAAEKKLEMFPLGVRNRPEVKIAAQLLVINEGLTKLLVEQQGKLAGNRIIQRTATNSGPTNAGNGAAGSKPNTVGSAWEQFKEARAKGLA